MSALIKSGSSAGLSAVRPLPPTNMVAVRHLSSAEDDERERLRRRVGALEAELQLRDAAIAKLRDDVVAARRQGQTEGYENGLAEADTRETERLALLEKTAVLAAAELTRNLSALERLAALLARDALELIFGDPDHQRELLAKIIRAEAAKIETAALIEIALSREDFPDDEALLVIAERAGVKSAMAIAKEDLPAGSCIMTLRLGCQDVSLHQQWGALRSRLEELAIPEART